MTVGIPRGLFYYYYGDLWIAFLDTLGVPYILSEETNREIVDLGMHYATDEMCLSMKIYLGHIASLKEKCDTILVPRIDNYGTKNQTCTNFLAVSDIVRNLFSIEPLTYNINYEHMETEEEAFKKIGKELGFDELTSLRAYHNATTDINYKRQKQISRNIETLRKDKLKILVVGHPYNVYDAFIGKPILEILKRNNVEIIHSSLFHENITEELGEKMQQGLYFKYSKNLMGAIALCEDKVDGIVFVTAFPCGIDSLVNEIAFCYLKIPHIEIVMDELDSMVGIETRLESFIDVLERNGGHEKNSDVSTNG